MSRVGNHPEIGSLIRRRDQIYALITIGNYPQAVDEMMIFLGDLKPEDKNTEEVKVLVEGLSKATKAFSEVSGRTYNHTVAKRLKFMRDIKSDLLFFYSRLNDILWNKNYLLDQTYRGINLKEVDLSKAEVYKCRNIE